MKIGSWLSTLLLLIVANSSTACDCYERTYAQAKHQDYNRSDAIFIADVVKIRNYAATFKVIECLKGNVANTISIETDECAAIVDKGERWLIYAESKSTGLYKIISCSLSRSFSNPIIIVSDKFIPNFPSPDSSVQDAKITHLSNKLSMAERKVLLFQEISELQQRHYSEQA